MLHQENFSEAFVATPPLSWSLENSTVKGMSGSYFKQVSFYSDNNKNTYPYLIDLYPGFKCLLSTNQENNGKYSI